ncbi:urease accessory protein UreF [Roseobacter sp. YSTF-M11]|uniref:Urease accessory protein UreF n=1 Tax=Roseobacter insulae TaxID=2859783 RepID=A0A9X1FWJ0_9RHOB|nr:urease accessory UreF family protein [Roseobacter insulae]MBW4708978.1 urease accessory protein UreF [Roseobacter insulae]
MTTDAVLTLTQWLSPGFPVGAFAYSHGLETAIETQKITHAKHLESWLTDLVCHGSGYADLVILAAAYQADDDMLAEVDATARAFAASAERLLETEQQGAAFARTLDAVWKTRIGPLTYPVAVGRAARLLRLPLDITARMYLHALVANLISASVRLVPLGQTEGQAALAALSPLIRSTAAKALKTPLPHLSSQCFALDIAAMHHEVQYSKVFRT